MATQTHNNSFFEGFNMFKGVKVPSIDFEAAMAEHRKNLEALQTAQKTAFEAAKTLSQTHLSYVKQSMDDFKDHVQDMMTSKNLEEKVQSHTERLKNSFETATSHAKGMAEIMKKSHEDITNTFSQRMHESAAGMKEWSKKAQASTKKV
jgi:phasin family protein